METGTDGFNLHRTLEAIGQAIQAIVCHMLFDFAIHGLLIVLILSLVSLYLITRGHKYGMPIRRVAKRIAIFCLLVSIPGVLFLLVNHHLPDAGVFSFNSIGLIGFWSLISVHLVAEEINTSMVKTQKNKTSENN